MNKKKEVRQNWYFSFGSGQIHEGCYVKYFGTQHETRNKMFDAFGPQWSMQYSEKQWNNPSEGSLLFQGWKPGTKLTLADVWNWKKIK